MSGLLASEWWKIRGLQSTWSTLGAAAATIVLTAAVAWSATATWDGLTTAQREHFALASLENLSSWIASLCLAAFGVLSITSEYATGTIRTTFAAVPKRHAVLAAKGVVVAVVGILSGLTISFGTALVARLIIGSDHPIRQQMAQTGILSSIAMSLSIAMFALLGLGVGAIMRSTTAAIAAIVVLWYFLPMFAQDLPSPWNDVVSSLVPGALSGQVVSIGNERSVYGAALSPLGALLAMAIYAIAPLGAAAILVARRDT